MPKLLKKYDNPNNKKPEPTDRVYTYPQNLIEDYEDYLQIKTYKYVSLSQYFTKKNLTSLISSTTSTPIVKFGEDNGGIGIARERFISGNVIDTFRLPMPESIQLDDAISWNLEDLKTIGRFAPTVAEQFAKGGDQTNTAQTLSALAKAAIPEGIIGIIEGHGFLSSGQALTQGFNGKILNPYQEQIFKGIEPRSFVCKYKLVPRNKLEQDSIYNIISKLRQNALPNYSKQSLTTSPDPSINDQFNQLGDRWLTTPNIFNLSFCSKLGEMSYLPQLKPMVLTSISVNYTPDGAWISHLANNDQPAPCSIDITMNYHEVEMITQKEVERGF